MKRAYMAAIGVTLSWGVLVSGCASSPEARFYTLTATATGGEPSAGATSPSVAIASVTLPELVNRPQLVIRTGPETVELLETDRWAEPLNDAAPRIMAEDLTRLLASDRVSSYPQAAALLADYRVYVDMRGCELSTEKVELDASWMIRRGDGPAVNGRSLVREAIRGGGYNAVAQAFSRGLEGISRDIAVELKKQWAVAPR